MKSLHKVTGTLCKEVEIHKKELKTNPGDITGVVKNLECAVKEIASHREIKK